MASRIRDPAYNAYSQELLISRSLHEYRILPYLTTEESLPGKVSLETRLCRIPSQDSRTKYHKDGKDKYLMLKNPVLGAAMQCVSAGVPIGVAMARHGSSAPSPRSITIESQLDIARGIKREKAGFQNEVVTLGPDKAVHEAYALMNEHGYKRIFITEDGTSHGKYLGVIEEQETVTKNLSKPIREMMYRIDPARENIGIDMALEMMSDKNVRVLPVTDDDGYLQRVAFFRDIYKHMKYKDIELVDSETRYMCTAAVSTHPNDYPRVDALANIVDAIFLDASDGFNVFQNEMLKYIRMKNPALPVIGGNVVTKEGFRYLAEKGFDAVKIGMGIGSGCTTQQEKGVGRGMATSIIEIVAERDRFCEETGVYIPLIADGSISNTSLMAIALALGVDAVMAGGWIAGFTESPSQLRDHPTHGELKEYYMEASEKALNYGRYLADAESFFFEGVEGWVRHKGSIYDGKDNFSKSLLKIKSAVSSAGYNNLDDFRDKVVVELQSAAAIRDALVHDIFVI